MQYNGITLYMVCFIKKLYVQHAPADCMIIIIIIKIIDCLLAKVSLRWNFNEASFKDPTEVALRQNRGGMDEI